MKVLLDTHTFLWWNMDHPQLSNAARSILSDGRNEVFLSVASIWEIAIKTSKGKLSLPETPAEYITSRLKVYRFKALPILINHAVHVYQLPHFHNDPFDRLLIAQSQLESLPLITADAEIQRYDLVTIW